LTLTVFIVVAAILSLAFASLSGNMRSALDDRAEEQVNRISDTLRQPLWNFDHDHIREVGGIFAADDLIQSLRIDDQRGGVLFESRKTEDNIPGISRSKEITHAGEVIGKVSITVSQARFFADLRHLLIATILTLLLALVVIGLGTDYLLVMFLRRPIGSLERAMDRLAAGDFSQGLEPAYRELEGITGRYGAMVERVRAREENLKSINAELGREVRERRATEDRSAFLNAVLLTQMENSPDGILMVSPEGRVILSNRNMAEMWRLPPGALDETTSGPLFELLRSQVSESGRTVEILKFDAGLSLPSIHEELFLTDGRVFVVISTPMIGTEDKHYGRAWIFRDATEQKRTEEALRDNEARYRTLFENSPISLWEEDCSGIKHYLDGLRASVSDFRSYFENHPEAVIECMSRIKVLDVNRETVRLMRAENKEELFRSLGQVFTEETVKVFSDELVALAEGETRFTVETVHRTLTGEDLDVSVTVMAAPGYEDSWSRVYVSIMDITDRKRAEEAARMMQFAVDRSRDAVYLISRDERLLYVNEAACSVLGYTREELLQLAVYHIDNGSQYPPEVWPAHWEELERRKSFVFESFHKRKDGTLLPVEISVNLLTFEGKQFNCAVARDITERKLAEAIQWRANLVLENSPAILFRWRAAPGWPVELVSENIRQLGYTPDQILSGQIPFTSMVHSEDLARVAREVEDYVKKGVDRFQQQYRVVCGDGNIRWVDDRTFVERNETGDVTHFQGIVMDISDRKDAEEALRASEAKFRSLFENMTEGVALHKVLLDSHLKLADYRALDVNPAFEMHTGMTADSLRGALASEIFGEGAAPFLEELSQVVATGRPLVFETFFAPLRKHFQISAFLPGEGLLATVFEDITRRKRDEEELRQKTEEMERFVYTISHDLKSPLVTIQAFLRFLEQDLQKSDETRVRSDLEHMRNATTRMSRLLEELLELSRIGRKVHPQERVPLQELVGEALDMVAGRIAERGVNVEVTPDPISLMGDRMRLVEVFQNLIDNAAKFTGEQSSPTVRIGAEESQDGLILYVKDNGMGIDPRHLGKIFGLFEKLEAGSEGTGVGLALVKRIIETHSGSIWVESGGLGKGVTFYFTLPGTMRQT
jgi:PAS domain S-box-containing protein